MMQKLRSRKVVKRALWVLLILVLAACQPATVKVGHTLCDAESGELLVVTRTAEYKGVQESESIRVIRLNKKCSVSYSETQVEHGPKNPVGN